MSESDRLLADGRALQRRGLLSSAELIDLQTSLASATCPSDAVRARVSSLLVHDLNATVDRVRQQRNEREQTPVGVADVAAAAAGGAIGALSAYMWPPTAAARPTLWTSAVDAAVATAAAAKHQRRVQPLRLQLVSGNAAACRHVVLCISGFMSARADATRQWRAWTADDRPDVAVFVVQWAAGDAAAWDAFGGRVATSSAAELLAHVAGNPWHCAQGQAEQVGALLAHVAAARPALWRDRTLSLLGHSLGGAVVYSALQAMAAWRPPHSSDNDPMPCVANAVSFAGAFVVPEGRAARDRVTAALDPRGGTFVNVYSSRDSVLSQLFGLLQLQRPTAATTAAGGRPLAFDAPHCVDVDVSDLVAPSVDNHFGHSYAHVMDAIRTRVRPHLFHL
ncbi:unnamed protein product [Hyaloperonospora brassicae]|uniref:Fungal lipase-like domain-containing protein n=1 Tax=Hyaloperonospora brassicae TaxID=162125 RepID=A0AAV0U717_HYABA|nr:unnamed protein product [Hyaloperonospora brassicae]